MKEKIVYSWNTGSFISERRFPAQAAGSLMEELAQGGELTPTALVNASRAEGTLLHDYFEWRDDVAAELYRERQAGHLIRSLTVRRETPTGRETQVRAFHSIKYRDEDDTVTRKYEMIYSVMSDDEKRERLLEQAARDMRAFQAKYSDLVELADVFVAMNAAEIA